MVQNNPQNIKIIAVQDLSNEDLNKASCIDGLQHVVNFKSKTICEVMEHISAIEINDNEDMFSMFDLFKGINM